MNFAAEQACELAADRKPETGAAVLAAGAGVGLLESLEDQFLFLQGDSDAGVGYLKGDDGRRVVEDRMLRAPAADGGRYGHLHAALGGEFERVRQQVFQNLLQTFRVGDHAAGEVVVDLDAERKLAVLGFVAERATNRLKQA